jgi:hypothetical protein
VDEVSKVIKDNGFSRRTCFCVLMHDDVVHVVVLMTIFSWDWGRPMVSQF